MKMRSFALMASMSVVGFAVSADDSVIYKSGFDKLKKGELIFQSLNKSAKRGRLFPDGKPESLLKFHPVGDFSANFAAVFNMS